MNEHRTIKDVLINIKPIYYIVIFYVLSVGLHFLLNADVKVMNVYPDELRFYDIAKNMYNGVWFTVRGIKIDYQKILYSIFLCPFFLIKDAVLRMRVIGFANCVVMCSSIFPMYMLYKYMYDESQRKMIDMWYFLLFSFSSMFLYTVTYMSENLYVPLYLWATVFFVKSIKNNDIISMILSSFIFFINYICREIMAVYYVSIVITILYFMIKKKSDYIIVNKKSIFIFVIIPIILYFICNFTIFKEVKYTYIDGTYDQLTTNVFTSIDIFLWMVKDCFYYIASVFVLFLFLPIIILVNEYKKMSMYEKLMLISNSINILLMSIVVAYTISIREELGMKIVRLHLRYSMVSIAIIAFICVKHFNINAIKNLFVKKSSIAIFIGMLLFSFIFFNGINSYWVDHSCLFWYRMIRELVQPLSGLGIDYARTFEMNIIFILLISVVIVLYVFKKYNIIKVFSWSIIVIIFLINNIYTGYNYREVYDCLPNVYKEAKMIDKYFDGKRSNVILCVGDKFNVMDVYFENGKNVLMIQNKEDFLKDCMGKSDVKNIEFTDAALKKKYNKVKHIDYIIMDNREIMKDIVLGGMVEVGGMEMRNYVIYKNKSPKMLNISIENE